MNLRQNTASRFPYLDNPESIIRAANAARRQAAATASQARLRARIQLGRLPALPASPPPILTTPIGLPPATPYLIPTLSLPPPTLPELTRSNQPSSNHMENITPTYPTSQAGSNQQPWLTTQTSAPPIGSSHQGMLQAQEDRAALEARIARLEEAILLLSVKSEATPQPTAASSSIPGRIDLQQF
ncbi:hypothetical protein PCANC_27654 [Puccinia coronata f. sp. avenae]|uniref:Uncharacterized protein n=1 Tax=Puccinia coronata f. sp. avenae TaxID=200324 RepID=A0A2N5RXZ8_9BASI|nr:hypothetical protein PCANC_27654 [Puccinia coronata f. sp. avenae]